MRTWLFQTHPNQYLLSASLAFLTREPWPVTRYKEKFQVGDLIFFGMYNTNEGIYALGRVVEPPADFAYPSGQVQSFWLDEDVILDNETWMWVEYLTKIHDEPLMRAQLASNPILAELPTFTADIGDGEFNFEITEDQAKALIKLFPGRRPGGDKLPEEVKGWL
ncbi:MAG: EVE domain-containing protein [bacterium]